MYDDADIYRELAPLLRVRPGPPQPCAAGTHSRAEPGAPHWAPFHIVMRGACLLDAGSRNGVHLQAGDIAVLPHGGPYKIKAVVATPSYDAPIQVRRPLHDELLIASDVDGESDTKVICGRCTFEFAEGNIVLAALPPVVVLAPGLGRDGDRLRAITAALCSELEDDRLGSAIVAANLATSLMLLALRAHLEAAPLESGMFALRSRPQTARVLAAMLTSPGQAWTLDELAGVAVTSRATLVRLFQKAVDAPPLAYLAGLRLGLARHRIMASNAALVVIAEDVGYHSESSFSRAYHRRFGVAPGADRGGSASLSAKAGGTAR